MSRVKQQIDTSRKGASRPCLRIAIVCLVIGLATALPTPAQAHDESGLAGGFAAGFLHPLSGFDHALAMVAVGLWGAILGRPMIVVLPTVFPLTMAFGGALGMAQVPMIPVEIGIAISVVALGLLVMLKVGTSAITAASIVAAFAVFHGYAHGQEAPSVADPVGYSAGFVLCTGLLHLFGIALGALKTLPKGFAALRSLGAAIALCGLWFVWRVLSA